MRELSSGYVTSFLPAPTQNSKDLDKSVCSCDSKANEANEVLLTQNIEDSLQAKKMTGAILVDLTTTCYTVWHRTLTCNLLRLLPDDCGAFPKPKCFPCYG